MKRITTSAFVDEMSAAVQQYLDEKDFYKNPVLTVGYDKGAIAVEIHEADKKKYLQDGREYALTDLYLTDEFDVELPNYEAMTRIAQEWGAV